MKSYILILIVLISLLFPAVVSSAEDIKDALSKAYSQNSKLNFTRASTRVADESVAEAKSGYKPTIDGSSNVRSIYNNSSGFNQSSTNGSIGLNINQTLFDGFQTNNNVYAAEARSAASFQQLRFSVGQTLFSAAQAYMNVLHDGRAFVLTHQNLAFAYESIRTARARLDVGQGTGTDVAQTEAFRAKTVAAVSLAEAQLRKSEAIYRQLIGDDAGKLKNAQPLFNLIPRNLDLAIVIGNKEHPAIIESIHLVDAAGYKLKSSEGSLLPQISATASISGNYSPTSELTSGGFGTSASGFGTSANVGLELRIPIYQAGKNAAIRQSRESLSQSRINVDVNRDEVRKAIVDAWSTYENALSSAKANKDNVLYTEIALRGVVEELSVGQRTTLDVLQARQDVTNAKLTQNASERDLVISTYAILQAIGWLSPERLGLKVAKYEPEEHHNAIKDKWLGFRTPDGR